MMIAPDRTVDPTIAVDQARIAAARTDPGRSRSPRRPVCSRPRTPGSSPAPSRICLDVCPTSNLLLSVYASIDDHPLRQLLDAGVRCSLNSDDLLLFGPNLLDEYELAAG